MVDLSNYIGIDYVVGGREGRLDCWGLVRLVYLEHLGIVLPENGGYDKTLTPETTGLIERHRPFWTKVDHPEPYDLVLFNINGMVNHIGLVASPGWMLHTTSGANSRLERYNKALWRSRIEGFYRHGDYCGKTPPAKERQLHRIP